MITDKDREALIKYRIQQANETIELAEFLKDSGRLIIAVNRVYYGMYYALTALALRNKFETSKHSKLIGWFNKEFVATNILNKENGKILRLAFQNRTKGDYDAFVEFSEVEVSEMINNMKQFIGDIELLVFRDD